MNANELESNLKKVVSSFCVVGLDSSHIHHNRIVDHKLYIERIDIIKHKTTVMDNQILLQDGFEKRLRIMPNGDYWMRILFTDVYSNSITNSPITSIKLVECEILNNDYIVSKINMKI